MNNRFLWLVVPQAEWERQIFGQNADFIYREGPKSPFESVTLATQQETGLFVRPLLPRITS